MHRLNKDDFLQSTLDSDSYDIDILLSRVITPSHIPNMIIFFQIPFPTNESVRIMGDEAIRRAKTLDKIFYLADYSENKQRETAEQREIGLEIIRNVELEHFYFVSGKNKFLNFAVRMIIGRMKLKSFSVHSKREEAFEHYEKHFNT